MVEGAATLSGQLRSPSSGYMSGLIAETPSADTSTHGWEINEIVPVSKDGTDDLQSVQPLH